MPRTNDQQTYRHQPNSVCITLYSPNGAPVSKKIQEEAARALTIIASRNNLLIGTANA